jgi:23S rRNA (uracil1939-C5)-methyltransferase
LTAAYSIPFDREQESLGRLQMNVAAVESLDQEGRGVARVGGKVVFIDGALPGEQVEFAVWRRKRAYDLASAKRIVAPSSVRARPRCPHFGVCGGCALQHLDPLAQIASKQRVLEDALWRIGAVRPESLLAPIHGPAWGYRHRARLSVRFVPKKGGVLVGFHEKRSSYVADMGSCEILSFPVSRLIQPLRELIGNLSVRARLPQVEVAVGEKVVVLVLRILQPLSAADEDALRRFADQHGVQLWLQPGAPESARPFHPEIAEPLYYTLPEFDVRIYFSPTEFTQVNPAVNAVLVRCAIELLAPRAGERVLDLFCGLGNFTLPIARRGADVIGVEGSDTLVERARSNAQANGVIANFRSANLFDADDCARLPPCDAMLIDPPRQGAIEVVKRLAADAPGRIVYVSCDPATLSRDAAVLVHRQNFRLMAAGVADMFPHTAHVESLALFVRRGEAETPGVTARGETKRAAEPPFT